MSRSMLRRETIATQQVPAPLGQSLVGVERLPVTGEAISEERTARGDHARIGNAVDSEGAVIQVAEHVRLEDMDAGEHQRCQRLVDGERPAEKTPNAVA